MKVIALFFFVMSSVSQAQEVSAKIDCLVGDSILKINDFNVEQLENKEDFFSRVAINSISSIIKNKPFNQAGVMFSLQFDKKNSPQLKGYFLIRERLDQIDLSKAKCSPLKGNKHGFLFTCNVTNPADQQNIVINFLYKYKLEMGVLDLKVSESSLGFLAKNKFTCMSN